ncbi:hypothetical protein PEDI_24490 [Persicobacter diffluens]|uniref:Uncharacterized protein n=2 Tax=Persicobacter diffluens TaxID=981 RepID=A0AAN4VYP9_9BACT|nr:hypothetical protein PEDI_24490 [Persicobacter diffluens]
MARYNLLPIITLMIFSYIPSWGQTKSVTYEELYDEPYEINKLFMKLQPVIAEVGSANMYVGFGLEAEYYHESLLNIKADFRRAYGGPFDLMQNLSARNNIQQVNGISTSTHSSMAGEIIGTYHIKDWEKDTETKMILYRSSYRRGNKWKSKVPDHIKVPSKVRKIYGARLGPYFQSGGIDVGTAMRKQGIESINVLREGVDAQPLSSDSTMYTNQSAFGFAVGGSLTWIKNFAIKPTRTYSSTASDMIISVYADMLITPWTNIENLSYDGNEYDLSPIKHNKFGFRLGADGKFNREFGWGYGIEIGMRPQVSKQMFYTAVKLSIPIFSTNLNHEVEAFSK